MTPAEVIEDVFRLLGVEGPEDAATVVLAALAEQGHVVVPDEAMNVVLDLVATECDICGDCDKPSCRAWRHLRAAVPEETTDDSQSPTVEPETPAGEEATDGP